MKMTYKAARDALEAVVRKGIVPGLDSITGLLEQMQRPDRKLRIIHVAGTNGKGSVNAYLYSIFGQAGYRVGRYSSPVVFHAREQFQAAGSIMSEDEYITEAEAVLEAMERMKRDGEELPTMFEAETAMAFSFFNRKKCDLVLLETGMGGRLDATNVIERPELCIFTPVSRDHMAMLGDTLAEIASEKAGILKAGTSAVSAAQDEVVMQVLKTRCEELQIPLHPVVPEELEIIHTGRTRQVFSYKAYELLEIHMPGVFQTENAVLALEAVFRMQEQGFHITEEDIREGLLKTEWPGRLEQIGRHPDIYIDGAHNVMAARALEQFLAEVTGNQELILILGMFKDKEYEEIVRILVPYAKQVITTAAPGQERALPAAELCRVCRRYHEHCDPAGTPRQALEMADQMAAGSDIIVAAGSLAYLNDIKQAMNK